MLVIKRLLLIGSLGFLCSCSNLGVKPWERDQLGEYVKKIAVMVEWNLSPCQAQPDLGPTDK